MVRAGAEQQSMTMGGYTFARIHQFRYLGMEIDE